MAAQHHYYDVLGVARDATVEEIKKAFKRAALQHHPDKGGDPERFKECNEGVGVLTDERQRAAYDLQLLRSRSRDGHGTADERAARRASSVQPPAAAPAPSAADRSQSSRPARPPRENVEIPADVSGLSVREIKDLLTQLGIRFDGCTEKAELLALLKPAAAAQAAKGPQTPRPKAEGPGLAKPIRIKVMSLGSGGTGKSCIIKRYCEGRFVQKYITTIGVDYGVKPCTILGQATKVNFFDTSGGHEFREIREEFYNNVSGVVLVYDVTDKRSFSDITKWIEEARDNRCLLSSKDKSGEKGPPFAVVCANKADQGRRAVGKNEGERLATEHGLRYFETSAATGDQVNEAFQYLFEKIINHQSEVRRKLNMSGG